MLFIPDEHFALVKNDSIELYDFQGVAKPLLLQDVAGEWHDHTKGGHEHFMLKEI